MILDALRAFGAWNWWIGGLILLGVEILAPGAFFLWFGLAALIVGALAFTLVPGWQAQAILFVVLAVLLALVGRRVYGRKTGGRPFLNDRAAALVGGVYALSEPIANGVGRVRIGDTTWNVSGPDLAAETRVRITGFDGTVLKVEAA